MPTHDDPDVLDVEFRDLPAAPPRATPPAGRRPARSRRAQREAAAARRIGLQHLAFFRGYLEGLDLAELADQYLEFGRDARKAAATRTWLITAFVAAARKRQDFATARLLAIRPAALAAAAAPAANAPARAHAVAGGLRRRARSRRVLYREGVARPVRRPARRGGRRRRRDPAPAAA